MKQIVDLAACDVATYSFEYLWNFLNLLVINHRVVFYIMVFNISFVRNSNLGK